MKNNLLLFRSEGNDFRCEVHPETIPQENGNDGAIRQRAARVGFDQPQVMDDAADGCNVNQAMQGIPSFSAHPFRYPVRGRKCEGNHEHEAGKPDGDKGTLRDVRKNLVPLEKLVEVNVRHEMKRAVEECKQSQHPPEFSGRRPASDPPHGRHAQCNDNESQRPGAGCVCNVVERVRAKVIGEKIVREKGNRKKAEEKNNRLEDFSDEFNLGQTAPSMSIGGFDSDKS